MITVGVDLAAAPKTTAVARLEWSVDGARLAALDCPADDAAVLARCGGAARIGVDSPFGWPEPFIDFVTRHSWNELTTAVAGGERWRQVLTNRSTDLECAEYTKQRTGVAVRPLSVSADLLGHAAMRCAVLLVRLSEAGIEVDRSGMNGRVAEVYPAAALALWDLVDRRYKGPHAARLGTVVSWLLDNAPLDLGNFEDRIRTSDHCFDAVVAALAARAVAIGRATEPAPRQRMLAEREGWIRLPTCSLADLVPARSST